MQHSQLRGQEGDAVIIGASSLEHFIQNINSCEKKGIHNKRFLLWLSLF